MNEKLKSFLMKCELLEPQTHLNLTIIPLIYKNGNTLDYISLDEAQSKKQISITEVSESGSVPELFLENNSDERILLFDGEELIGAKQNRILNTSILIDKRMKVKIPVSCVESGRWHYSSKEFSTSNRITPAFCRMEKMEDVSDNLRSSKGLSYRSDQSRVWENVRNMSERMNVKSDTEAMSEIFEKRQVDIDEYVNKFKVMDKQNGMIIQINGSVVGIEYVSNSKVLSKVFNKLIRGYSIDAIMELKEVEVTDPKALALEFIQKVANSTEEVFKSPGLGNDHRLSSDEIIGISLIAEDETVYFNALNRDIKDMPSFMRRIRDL